LVKDLAIPYVVCLRIFRIVGDLVEEHFVLEVALAHAVIGGDS